MFKSRIQAKSEGEMPGLKHDTQLTAAETNTNYMSEHGVQRLGRSPKQPKPRRTPRLASIICHANYYYFSCL